MFQAIVNYEKSDFVEFSRLHFRTKAKKSWITLLVCAAVLGVVELFQVAICLLTGEAKPLTITLMVLIPILIVEFLLMPRIQAGTVARTYRKLGTREMDFEENEVQVRDPNACTRFLYGAFESVYHAKNAYYLYINRQQALVIPERCLTQGDPAAFGAFLAEKTGLEVKEIK